MAVSCIAPDLPSEKPTMKERILETADRLFYRQGIRAVGVDTIAAEIGIRKRTLYNHFPSKDALISAYLERPVRPAPALRQAAGRTDPAASSTGWSGRFADKGFAAARSSMRSPNSAPRISAVKKIAIAVQGKPPALVSRPADRSSASRTRKSLRRSFSCWSTARSRRIWCAAIRRWRAPQERRGCCWRMPELSWTKMPRRRAARARSKAPSSPANL